MTRASVPLYALAAVCLLVSGILAVQGSVNYGWFLFVAFLFAVGGANKNEKTE